MRYTIRSPRQLRSIRSPVRQRILEVMERRHVDDKHHDGWSVSEIATAVGLASESLYYHVHALVKARLLLRSGDRSTGRRQESLYRLVAEEIVVDPEWQSKAFGQELTEVGSTAMRAAERSYRHALASGAKKQAGSEGVAELRRWILRLEPKSLERLQELLQELEEFARKHDGATGQLYELTAVLSSGRD